MTQYNMNKHKIYILLNTNHIQYTSAILSIPRQLKHGRLCKIWEHTFFPANTLTSEFKLKTPPRNLTSPV